MEVDLENESYKIVRELYKAVYNNSDAKLIELCTTLDDGPLHVCTIHNDTVLHKLAYTKNFQLAIKLVDELPENFTENKLMRTNDWGNTLLHNASTSNKGVEFIKKLLRKAPQLMQVRNKWGETAVFQASRYGRRHMFEFLAGKVDSVCQVQNNKFDHLYFLQRADKTTVLHMAVLTGYYDMALIIARKYPELCSVQAHDRLTALQILACSPTAFRSGTEMSLPRRLLYSCISTNIGRGIPSDEATQARGLIKKYKPWCTWPWIDKVRTQKKRHEDVLQLAKFLVPFDTSWVNTYSPRSEIKPVIINISPGNSSSSSEQQKKEGEEIILEITDVYESVNNDSDDHQEEGNIESRRKASYKSGLSDIDDTPLLLAAKRGCIEIVEEILNLFPQAVEYINHQGRTVLHVAIQNRNLSIFQLVLNTNLDHRSNLRVIDCYGNSILHMVASRRQVSADAKMKTPVLQLSEDLLLMEELKIKCPISLINHRNKDMKTADELLVENNEELRAQAKEWLKRTAEHCTVIIILIATVAFAAAYTVPGGPNQETGFPILITKPFFLAFTMSDVLSLTFALTAVVIFLAILTSSFRLKSFSRTLPQKLMLGLTFLFLSVSMMMVSFAATVILMTSDREHWAKIAVYIAAFFPVCIFVLSYIPLYIQLAHTCMYWVNKFREFLPVLKFARKTGAI